MKYQLNENQGRHIMKSAKGDPKARLNVYPGQIIDDKDWFIPAGMKADFTPLEPVPVKPIKLPFTVTQTSPGWFDVIHPVTHKPINSKSLRKQEAESLAGQTIEEYDAKLAQDEAARQEAERKQTLIDKILAVDGCTLKAEELAELSFEDLEALAADEPKDDDNK